LHWPVLRVGVMHVSRSRPGSWAFARAVAHTDSQSGVRPALATPDSHHWPKQTLQAQTPGRPEGKSGPNDRTSTTGRSGNERFQKVCGIGRSRLSHLSGHLRRAPTGTSSRKPARMGLPPSSDAATIMPFDSMPRSLRGWRLATMTTLRPTIWSGL
jgi:hypothetical protein